MTETRFYEPARLSTPNKPLFSLKPLDATTWLRSFLSKVFPPLTTERHLTEIFGAYRKIPKIGPGAYIFQRPFLRGLFLEGLIFGGAYLRRGLSTEGNLCLKIDWASFIVGSKFTVFALFYFVFEAIFELQAPGGLIFGGTI